MHRNALTLRVAMAFDRLCDVYDCYAQAKSHVWFRLEARRILRCRHIELDQFDLSSKQDKVVRTTSVMIDREATRETSNREATSKVEVTKRYPTKISHRDPCLPSATF